MPKTDLFGKQVSKRQQHVVLLMLAAANLLNVLTHAASNSATQFAADALAVIQGGVLWWLNRRPLAALTVTTAADAVLVSIFPSSWPGMSLVQLSFLAMIRPAVVSLGGLTGVVVAYGLVGSWSGHLRQTGLWCLVALLAWSWGALSWAWSQRRQAQEEQSALQERALVAREVHDVVAHTVSVMVIQATAADDAFDRNPEAARAAIRQVELAGRQALVEMRWFLRTMRAGDLEAREVDAPQPTLADVGRLAETMSDASLQVTVLREGDGHDDVPRALGLNLQTKFGLLWILLKESFL